MIHHSWLWHNLMRWLVAYLHGRKASCLYQYHYSPSWQGSTGIRHLPKPSSTTLCRTAQFLIQTSRPILITSRCWPLLPSSWRLRRYSSLVRWVDGKQIAIAPQKSGVTLFTSDTHQSWLHPHVVMRWLHWTEPLKSWVSCWTPTSPSALTLAIVSSGLWGLLTSWKP